MEIILANEAIRQRRVLVIDHQGNNLGEMDTFLARTKAKEAGFDLVQVGLNSTDHLPVCRFMDYGKYKYEQSKKKKTQVKPHTEQTKEMMFKLQTSEHDIDIKKKKIQGFLEKSYKVKFGIELRGRERSREADAKTLLKGHADSFGSLAKYDRINVSDKTIYVTLTPSV